MSLPPRDSKGRFIAYKECQKKQCKDMRDKLAKSTAEITHLQSTLNKEQKVLLTPLGIFFGFFAFILLCVIIAESL